MNFKQSIVINNEFFLAGIEFYKFINSNLWNYLFPKVEDLIQGIGKIQIQIEAKEEYSRLLKEEGRIAEELDTLSSDAGYLLNTAASSADPEMINQLVPVQGATLTSRIKIWMIHHF